MEYFLCDLHVHTALSACANAEMNPVSIVKRCVDAGVNIVAIADHNSAMNVEAVCRAASDTGLLVVPAIEVQTSEEIHIVVLFQDCCAALEFEKKYVRPRLPDTLNVPELFGEQLMMNSSGEVIGTEPILLSNSIDMGVNELVSRVRKIGAVCVAAHAARPMHGYLFTLGLVVPGYEPDCYEFGSKRLAEAAVRKWHIEDSTCIVSSDAHSLEQIVPARTAVRMDRLDTACLLSCLKHGRGERVVILDDCESR